MSSHPHTCADPVFHEALDMAGKIAAIRQVLDGDEAVTVDRADLQVILRHDAEDLARVRRTGAYRRLCEAAGIEPE